MTAEERLARAFIATQPDRAARVLEQLAPAAAADVLRAIPPAPAAVMIGRMTAPHASTLLGRLEPAAAAAVATHMPSQQLATTLRLLEPAAREALLDALPQELRAPLSRMLPYPEGTAGAAMDPAVFRLPDDVLVADARTRLRLAGRDLLYYVYVVDREQHLVGVLDIAELMVAPARARLRAMMHDDVEQLSAWMPVAMVQEHPAWQRLHALPVVDEDARLVGAIRYQTLRRLEQESGERTPDVSGLTARALGELFQVGTTGLVAGVAATASGVRARTRGARLDEAPSADDDVMESEEEHHAE